MDAYMRANEIGMVFCEVLPSTIFLKFAQKRRFYYFAHNAEAYLAKQKAQFETNLFKKLYLYLDYFKIRKYENSIIEKAEKNFFFTERDANLAKSSIDKSFIIIPIVQPRKPKNIKEKGKKCLIATNMAHFPNEISMNWFIEEVLPHIESDIQLIVTGKDKNNLLKNCSSRYPNFIYKGFISSDELDELYEKIDLVLNPTISGSGFQMKLLEALANGKDVVTTLFSNQISEGIKSTNDPLEFASLVNLFFAENFSADFDYASFFYSQASRFLSVVDYNA